MDKSQKHPVAELLVLNVLKYEIRVFTYPLAANS